MDEDKRLENIKQAARLVREATGLIVRATSYLGGEPVLSALVEPLYDNSMTATRALWGFVDELEYQKLMKDTNIQEDNS